MHRPVALTIAGSDPSGGAGIQADLKTFQQRGVYGMSVITLLTVQNSRTVEAVEMLEPGFALRQLDAVLQDIQPHAAKTGALGTRKMIEAVAARAADFSFPLVVDPVMISKHGKRLLEEDAVEALRCGLLPQAYLVTPNQEEAEVLAGLKIEDQKSVEHAAKVISGFGPEAVLIKGGHLKGDAVDTLYSENRFSVFSRPRIATSHTHGTGCTFSAAITAELAKGETLIRAVEKAKDYITLAIQTNPQLGQGMGPVNHHAHV